MAESTEEKDNREDNDQEPEQTELKSLNPELSDELRDEFGDDELVDMYREMVLIRRFEDQAGRAYQQKKIKGFCHLYTGQEAVTVGASRALEDHDYALTAYRDHGQAIAHGMDPDEVMAELFGKVTGSSRGKGGSMHLFDIEENFYGGWAIVGGHIPLATGIGFAINYRDEDAVCLCYFGEGAVHQGVVHESLNMAANWDLPVVYLIENNRYAMGTSIERASAVEDLRKKADSYDMDADNCDGQDVFEVYSTVQDAVKRAREDSRPTLLDVKTYRYKGHSMTDPATYRDKSELEKQQQRDPIQRFSNWLIEEDICEQDALHEIDAEAKEKAKESVKFADESDFPPEEELTKDVYAEWPDEYR